MSAGKIPLVSESVFIEQTDKITDAIDKERYSKTEIDTKLEAKQDKLIAGENITIEGNVISAQGGGIPVEHKHSIDDIYTAVKLGGEWRTNLSVIHKDLSEAVRLNEELLQWLNDNKYSVEDYAIHISGDSPITDSSGGNWFRLMLGIDNIVLKTKLSPNSSIYDIQYGSVIKIAGKVESPEDLDKMIVTPSDKIINVTIANTQLENKTVTDKIELFTLLSENLRPETPEEVDALVEKYSNSAIAVTIQPVQEDGERIDIDSMSFNDFMESEIASMFTTVVFILVSEDTLAPIMGDDETESMKQFKLRFDEVEGETVYKTPLSNIIYNMQGTAEQAQNTANNAQSIAEQAQNTANNAQSTAEQAGNTAEQAQSTAESAQNTANNAQSTAEQAGNTAEQAQSTAESAQNTANNAQSIAEQAQNTANNAQSTAEQAGNTAEQAQSTAEQAQGTAESAQSTANQAQSTAEQAQSTLAERYTNTEINNLVSSIPKFSIKVVASLPTSNISTTTVYLLAKQNQESSNLYTEYIYVDNKWEKLGEQVVDLSDYFTKQQTQTAINTAVANFLTETQIRTIVQEMIDTATNKMVESNTITDIEKMTESEYAALETKSETTMYAIVDDEVVGNA